TETRVAESSRVSRSGMVYHPVWLSSASTWTRATSVDRVSGKIGWLNWSFRVDGDPWTTESGAGSVSSTAKGWARVQPVRLVVASSGDDAGPAWAAPPPAARAIRTSRSSNLGRYRPVRRGRIAAVDMGAAPEAWLGTIQDASEPGDRGGAARSPPPG